MPHHHRRGKHNNISGSLDPGVLTSPALNTSHTAVEQCEGKDESRREGSEEEEALTDDDLYI